LLAFFFIFPEMWSPSFLLERLDGARTREGE